MTNNQNRIEELVSRLTRYNKAYRQGKPLVTDAEYDALVETLRQEDPDNSFLKTVEPEEFNGKNEIKHPVPMLSIDSIYYKDDLIRFVDRVEKAAAEIGIGDVRFKVTAKLDGIAGRDDGEYFVTRGNGVTGYEISSGFRKGIIPIDGRGQGLGEIVMKKSYFDEHLKDKFDHPRNMVAGIVAADSIKAHAQKPLFDKAIHFVPYTSLFAKELTGKQLIEQIDSIGPEILARTDYPTDGLVISATDPSLKDYMGATSHHYRWQIAFKTKGDTAKTVVNTIVWQVGRTGNVTPVLDIDPVKLSGATIRRVSAHNAGLIKESRVGPGSEIEIIRSGEVIPKIIDVITPSPETTIPDKCPVCDSDLSFGDKFLKCENPSCSAKIVQNIAYWFKTIGNADWFGIKSIEKLVEKGYDSLIKIYRLTVSDYLDVGFGPVQSENFVNAVRQSIEKPVEDWRFLAAFGINHLGTGDSRKLLSHIPLEKLLSVTSEQIGAIHGFGSVTSESIVKGIEEKRTTIEYMLSLNFNLEKTPLIKDIEKTASPVAGKKIVFTGKMVYGSREDIQSEARSLGAWVQSSVSSKTDYLVCGEKTGAKKMEKARNMGVEVISENDYRQLIS